MAQTRELTCDRCGHRETFTIPMDDDAKRQWNRWWGVKIEPASANKFLWCPLCTAETLCTAEIIQPITRET